MNDTYPNDTQHNDTRHLVLSLPWLGTEPRIFRLFSCIFSHIASELQQFVRLNVIMLSAILLNVVAPFRLLLLSPLGESERGTGRKRETERSEN
jgi:hypothetical protein